MSIRIKAVGRKNPQQPENPAKYYASVVKKGYVDVDQLAKRVAYSSSTNRSDVYAVIMALLDVIPIELAEGNIVQLGKLGSFSIVVNSEGAETEAEVNSQLIKNIKVRFIPGKELKEEAKKFSFTTN